MTRGWAWRILVAAALGAALAAMSRWVPTWLDGWWPWPPLPEGSAWGRVAEAFAWATNPVVPTLALLLVALWAGRRRLLRLAARLVTSSLLSLSIVTVLKVLVGRERPSTPWLGVLTSDASFPSGHAAAATVLACGLIALAREARWPPRRSRWWAAAWMAFAVLVGVARLLLRVHHLSDVVAGVLVGIFAHALAAAFAHTPARPALPGRRYAVVSNPVRVRNAGLLRRVVEAEAGARGWSLVGWHTTTVEEPGAAACEAALAAGAELVLVVGGDGTQRAACSAIAHSPATLGLVPHGSGDLLARALRVPRDLPTAVRAALEGTPTPVDLLRVELDGRTEVSAVMVGVGADAAVLRDTSETWKRRVGPYAYLAAGARHIAARPVPTRVVVDGEEILDGAASLVEIGNVADLHQGITLLPGATPFDGVVDVLTASPDGVGDVARMIAGVLAGRTSDRQLTRDRGRAVEVTSAAPVPCQIDGELMGDVSSLRVAVDPGAVRVSLS
ncbi:phosphatase PAP2 family protein [Tessaracoccus palaemonis]|uniref:Phosphatase PAP2 family protein n=1 Tax=Tessaracoccus palaemonis TaxID=2829499 RepID=A0ABX8SKG3_9ACTN|nr:phosphatase PAP2 family protein [Tessaracoccus palaemonis]QXT63130.1 phosphatase PAP2 family protein [Tessaracoccus palaemonis]